MMTRSSRKVDFTNTELCLEKRWDDDTVSTIGSTDSFDDDDDSDTDSNSSSSSISSGRRRKEIQVDMKDFLKRRRHHGSRQNKSSPDLFAATTTSRRPRRNNKADNRSQSPKLNARWGVTSSSESASRGLISNSYTRMRSLDDLGLTLSLKAKSSSMRKTRSLDDDKEDATTTKVVSSFKSNANREEHDDDDAAAILPPGLCRWSSSSSSNQLRRTSTNSSNDSTPRIPRASAPDLNSLMHMGGICHNKHDGGRANARWSTAASSTNTSLTSRQRRSMTSARTRLSPQRRPSNSSCHMSTRDCIMAPRTRREDASSLLGEDSERRSSVSSGIFDNLLVASAATATATTTGSNGLPVRGSLSRWNSSSSFKTINSSINGGCAGSVASTANVSDQWSTAAPKMPRRRRRSDEKKTSKKKTAAPAQEVVEDHHPDAKEDTTATTMDDTTESSQQQQRRRSSALLDGMAELLHEGPFLAGSADGPPKAGAASMESAAKVLEEHPLHCCEGADGAKEEPADQTTSVEAPISTETEDVEAESLPPGCVSSDEDTEEDEEDVEELDSSEEEDEDEDEEEGMDNFETFLYMESILEEEVNEDETMGAMMVTSCALDLNSGTSGLRCDSALLLPKRRNSLLASMDESSSGVLDMSLSRSATSTRRGSDKTMYSSSTGRGFGSRRRGSVEQASGESAPSGQQGGGLQIPRRRASIIQEVDSGVLPQQPSDSVSVSSIGSATGGTNSSTGQHQRRSSGDERFSGRRNSNPDSFQGGLPPEGSGVAGRLVRRPSPSSFWTSHKQKNTKEKDLQGGEYPCHPLLDERHPLAASAGVVATSIPTIAGSPKPQTTTSHKTGVMELSTKQYPALAA